MRLPWRWTIDLMTNLRKTGLRKTGLGKLGLLALLGVVCVAGVTGLNWWSGQDDAQKAYATQPVALGDVEETVSAVGSLQPLEYVDVGAQVSGQLQKIHVQIGAVVEQGQLLAEIDPTLYQSRVSADEAQIKNFQAQIAERQAEKKLLSLQLQRQKQLLAARATSQDSYDIAASSLEQTNAQIAALTAQMEQTQSTLRGDQANVRYTKIYAPMAGTIVSLTARQGQTLNANQQAPTILRIADLHTMTILTQVSEADVPKLKIGMPAYFTTLGRPDRRWDGVLRQILPTPEVVNNVVLFDALFDVTNVDGSLLPQMSAQVFFVLAQAKQVPVVPAVALRRLPGRQARYAVSVMEDGHPVQKPVEIGVSNRVLAEVKSGVKVGDQIVLDAPVADARPANRQGAPGPRTPRL